MSIINIIKENIIIYIFLAFNKIINFSKKISTILYSRFEIKKIFVKELKIILFIITHQVDFCFIYLLRQDLIGNNKIF